MQRVVEIEARELFLTEEQLTIAQEFNPKWKFQTKKKILKHINIQEVTLKGMKKII